MAQIQSYTLDGSRITDAEAPGYANRTELQLPEGSQALHVQVEGEDITLYVLAPENQPLKLRTFDVYVSWVEVPENPGTHVGTVLDDGVSVHVFDSTMVA